MVRRKRHRERLGYSTVFKVPVDSLFNGEPRRYLEFPNHLLLVKVYTFGVIAFFQTQKRVHALNQKMSADSGGSSVYFDMLMRIDIHEHVMYIFPDNYSSYV